MSENNQYEALKKEFRENPQGVWSKIEGTVSQEQRDLIIKIANQASVDDLKNLIEKNELPPLKLTPVEMEMLQGGGLVGVVIKVLKFVLGLVIG